MNSKESRRGFFVAAVVACVLSTAFVHFKKPLAERAITTGLKAAGWSSTSFKVSKLSPQYIEIIGFTGLYQGRGTVSVDVLRISFSLPRAILQDRVGRVAIGPGEISLSPDVMVNSPQNGHGGDVVGHGGGETALKPLSFDRLQVVDIDISIDTALGTFATTLNGDLSANYAGSLLGGLDAMGGVSPEQRAELINLLVSLALVEND